MGIMTRILRLWKADIHGVMDQIEDHRLLLKQHLREMENSLHHKKTKVQELLEGRHRIQNDIDTRTQECEKLENDLDLALHKEKDNIAKLLIRKLRAQRHHIENMQQQHDGLSTEYKQVSQLLDEQRLQYETLKVKAGSFILQTEEGSKAYKPAHFSYTSSGLDSIDDHEIELELIRRKEHLKTREETS